MIQFNGSCKVVTVFIALVSKFLLLLLCVMLTCTCAIYTFEFTHFIDLFCIIISTLEISILPGKDHVVYVNCLVILVTSDSYFV